MSGRVVRCCFLAVFASGIALMTSSTALAYAAIGWLMVAEIVGAVERIGK